MPAPTAPSNLAIATFSSQAVGVTWADNSGDETSFFVEYRAQIGGGWGAWKLTALPGNRTTHDQPGLLPDTNYEFRVSASNSSGASGYSNVATVKTLGLYAKAWINASAAGVTGVQVEVWRAPVSGDGPGEHIHTAVNQAFRSDLEVGPSSGQSEAVMIVALPVPLTVPVLQNADPLRMYMVAYVGGVKTFTQITSDAQVVEAPSEAIGIGGVGGGSDDGSTTGGASAPTVSGLAQIGRPLVYGAGLRSPISGSWWVVDGKRIYPTDRAFVGTDMDVGGALQAEDVVNGVSHYSAPVVLTAAAEPVAEIVESKLGGISAVANVDGRQPEPVAPDGLRFRSENIKRVSGGGLQLITNSSYGPGYVSAFLDADSVDHLFSWSGINQNAFWLEAQFDGTDAEYSLYDGAPSPVGGLAVRISRGDNFSNWQVQVIKYPPGGAEVQIGSTQSIPAGLQAVSVAIDRTRGSGAAVITVTPDTGSAVTFSFADATVGRWIAGKMLGNAGVGSPTMEIQGGLGNGAGSTSIPSNDRYQTLLFRDFSENQNRSIIADQIGPGVEFLDRPRWYPTVINEEAQVYVSGSDYRGHPDNPAGSAIAHDPFQWTSDGLEIVAREATMAERLFINSQSVIHTYADHSARVSLSGFTPPVAQRGPDYRVRVASDNTFWYMHPPDSNQAGQWRRVGARYLSGCLALRGIFESKYGGFRLRVEGEKGPGVWFGAWLIPSSKVESAEIDIVETGSTSEAERGSVHLNTHTPDTVNEVYSSLDTQQPSSFVQFPVGGDITDEHSIECIWDHERIRWYLDGRIVHVANNIAFEDMALLLTLAVSNGNDGFQEPYDTGESEPIIVAPPASNELMTDAEWHALLMADMQGDNDALPSKLNEGDGFSGGTIKAEIIVPTSQSLIEQCAGPNIYNATGGTLHNTLDTLVPWGWFWEQAGNQYPDALIVMGDMACSILDANDNWVEVFSGMRGYGYVNGGGFSSLNDRGPEINGVAQPARGTNLTLLKVSRLRPLELWPEGFWTFQNRALMAGMKGWHLRMTAWLEGPYRDLAKIQACLGGDPYEYQSAYAGDRRPGNDFPYRAQDGGHGRYKTLTSTPQLITCTSVGPTFQAPGPRPPWAPGYNAGDGPAWPWGVVGANKLLSSSQLLANLPPKPTTLPVPQ